MTTFIAFAVTWKCLALSVIGKHYYGVADTKDKARETALTECEKHSLRCRIRWCKQQP